MIIDLSVPVTTGMPVYPGDPEVALSPALTVESDGVNVLRVHMSSHSGTHVDAPCHVDRALPDLDALPLDRFLGPAVVADARGLPPRAPVPAELVAPHLRPGVILLIATGWSAYWGTGDYLAHPYLSPEAATAIVEAGVRTVAIDALSVDPTPADDLPAHRILCGAHAVIGENFANLTELVEIQRRGRPIEVSLLPLRLQGGDGAPVRAVARVG